MNRTYYMSAVVVAQGMERKVGLLHAERLPTPGEAMRIGERWYLVTQVYRTNCATEQRLMQQPMSGRLRDLIGTN